SRDVYRRPRYISTIPTRRSSDLHVLGGCKGSKKGGRLPAFVRPRCVRLSRLTANPHRLTTATENPAKGNRIRTPPLQMVCSRRRSEEHTSELQSRSDLVCRLLLD